MGVQQAPAQRPFTVTPKRCCCAFRNHSREAGKAKNTVILTLPDLSVDAPFNSHLKEASLAHVVSSGFVTSNPRSRSWQRGTDDAPEGLVKEQEIPKSRGRLQNVRQSSR